MDVKKAAATLRDHLVKVFGDASEELVETMVEARITSRKMEFIDGIIGTVFATELKQFLGAYKSLGKAKASGE